MIRPSPNSPPEGCPMYKSICVALFLLPTLALAQRSTSTPVTSYASPQIVAKGKLPNQTAPILTTTIFTPIQTGLYRLSMYATLTRTDPNSQSLWQINTGWTDDAGGQLVGGL